MRSKQLQSCKHRPFLTFSHHLLFPVLLREADKDENDDDGGDDDDDDDDGDDGDGDDDDDYD